MTASRRKATLLQEVLGFVNWRPRLKGAISEWILTHVRSNWVRFAKADSAMGFEKNATEVKCGHTANPFSYSRQIMWPKRSFLVPLAILAQLYSLRAHAQDCSGEAVTTTASPPQMARSMTIHRMQLTSVRSMDVDLILIGDSLAEFFEKSELEPMTSFNLGVGGDQTQNVLYRLSSSEWAKIKPRYVVIILGTNNLTTGDEPCAIVAGIKKLIERVNALWPTARIVVLEIPPRGDGFLEFNKSRTQVNTMMRNIPNIATINVDDEITCGWQPTGWKACKNYLADNLHFSQAGYRVIAAALKNAISR